MTIAVSGTSGTPGGTVILTGGGYTSTAATLVNGNATINVIAGALAVGSDALTVSYTPANTFPGLHSRIRHGHGDCDGVCPTQDFSIGGSAVTLAPGATSGNTSTITITPSGGFTGNVQFIASDHQQPHRSRATAHSELYDQPGEHFRNNCRNNHSHHHTPPRPFHRPPSARALVPGTRPVARL